MPYFESETRSVKLYYELHPAKSNNESINNNNAENIIFIMGLWTDGAAWKPQTDYFSNLGYNCLSYDNRGCGRSSAPKSRYTTQIMAEDALELVNFMGWNQFHIAGISMGGMISQEFALLLDKLNQNNRVLSLTLIATHAGGINARAPVEGIKSLFNGIKEKDPEKKIVGSLKTMYSKATLNNPEAYSYLLNYHTQRFKTRIEPAPIGIISHLLAVGTHHVNYNRLLRLRYTDYPILIVVGTEDKLVREFNSVILSRVTGGELLVLTDIGHGVTSEYKTKFNKEYEKHLIAAKKYREQFNQQESKNEYKKQLNTLNSQIFDPNETKNNNNNDNTNNAIVHRYSAECSALSLTCSHNPACFVHIALRAFKGFWIGLAFKIIYSAAIKQFKLDPTSIASALPTSPSSSLFINFLITKYTSLSVFQSGVLFASVSGFLVSLFCIFNGVRSRLAMRRVLNNPEFQLKLQENRQINKENKYLYGNQDRLGFPTGYGLEWPIIPAILALAGAFTVYKQFQ